jgi:serine/threonine protein kinase
MIDGKWKMGDLGLIKFRDEDIKIDSLKDRIGPFGYYSPEAVNYGLNLRKDEDNGFFCHIDDKSDIYQLGLVFWYIFNQQIPTGQVIADDLCLCHGPNFFDKITMPMLQYCKKRRASMTDLREQFDVMLKECGVI